VNQTGKEERKEGREGRKEGRKEERKESSAGVRNIRIVGTGSDFKSGEWFAFSSR
jgi:hypothetical protein